MFFLIFVDLTVGIASLPVMQTMPCILFYKHYIRKTCINVQTFVFQANY